MSPTQTDPQAWLTATTQAVNDRLLAFFARKSAEIQATSPDSVELIDQINSLTMRGGKRVRPLVLAAAFVATKEDELTQSVHTAGAAFELMQSFFLIHDDWMDSDVERRGGVSVHHALSEKHGDAAMGASLGILAGDLAATCAWELILRADFPDGHRREALDEFAQIQTKVYLGQHLDITSHDDVAKMHQLKTGAYTVDGPARVGGLLAGADAEQLAALSSWAEPLGQAFQLRDDLLGAFGDSAAMGKPGDDLRRGRRTAVFAAFENLVPEHDRGPVARAFGNPEADDVLLQEATLLLKESGAQDAVVDAMNALSSDAEARLQSAPLTDAGKRLLQTIAHKLTARSH